MKKDIPLRDLDRIPPEIQIRYITENKMQFTEKTKDCFEDFPETFGWNLEVENKYLLEYMKDLDVMHRENKFKEYAESKHYENKDVFGFLWDGDRDMDALYFGYVDHFVYQKAPIIADYVFEFRDCYVPTDHPLYCEGCDDPPDDNWPTWPENWTEDWLSKNVPSRRYKHE